MLFCFYFTLSFGRVCLNSLQNLQSIINCEIYVLNPSCTFHRQHTVVFFRLVSTIQLRLLTLTLRGASQQPSSVWYEANTNENQLEERKKFKKKNWQTLLTAFMSMVMLVCEDVWLSDVGQEFTEDKTWTRPVCWRIKRGVINRHRHHVVIK